VQEIDSAALSLWIKYRQHDGELGGGGPFAGGMDAFRYVSTGAIIYFLITRLPFSGAKTGSKADLICASAVSSFLYTDFFLVTGCSSLSPTRSANFIRPDLLFVPVLL
jgi:hypothetical protein